jgi:crotonobetainyl-CoA:carnitine CoA-transferase CaiB-like acyl-CoA transferase
MTGMHAAIGIRSALHHRAKKGEGGHTAGSPGVFTSSG